MTWFKFILWLAVIYTLYYGGLICWELLRTKRMPGEEQHELTFVDEAVPLKTVPTGESHAAAAAVSAVVSSGGVKIKDIFRLAQEEAIEYIRPVSF
ncbi:hypothetical protein HH214_08735 [Mucilaginibacter robiniae]|uniref:Uncharacterized protein n=1 Tax=Mucilaginibacter robiniae TaxID=2728022 RepID=A0A7L5E2U0_9SPHI|nr:hypothetical protein [Mucilaginibacter robiniae]QJD95954.1 hypothetical protein HH214_08735 [Mucilaginibacter robiniae]